MLLFYKTPFRKEVGLHLPSYSSIAEIYCCTGGCPPAVPAGIEGRIWTVCAKTLPSAFEVPVIEIRSPTARSERDPVAAFITWVELDKNIIFDPPSLSFTVILVSSFDSMSPEMKLRRLRRRSFIQRLQIVFLPSLFRRFTQKLPEFCKV